MAGKLKVYPKPKRKSEVTHRLRVYDGDTPADVVKSLKNAHGLDDFPEGAYFSVERDEGYSYCYCFDGPCSCGCACTAECHLVWTSEEDDISFGIRVKEWERLVAAQAKRQAKKKLDKR